MGEVYRAKDPRLGREVAIKVLPASFSADADRLRRFEQEARAAGVLNHPNITAVYDIGQHEGAPYVVQELLEGETLRSALAGGKVSPRKAIDYALQIAHGLAAAHEKGIVHRDLKPENLFVTKDGRLKILDFGLAKLTHQEEGGQATNLPTASAGTEPGVVMGTLGYMSPEQVKGRSADARSDIFSFGAILYEILSGNRAFHGDSAAETMSAILREEPPDLSVTNQSISPGLERIVRHCIEKNPEQRFHSAHDLAFDLEAISGTSGTTSTAIAAAMGKPAPRIGKLSLAGLVATALLAGLLGGRVIWKTSPRLSSLVQEAYLRRGPVTSARFAPDGQMVVYTASWDGARTPRLYSVRAESPESLPLPFAGRLRRRRDLPRRRDAHPEAPELLDGVRAYRHAGPIAAVRERAARDLLEDVGHADWSPDGSSLAVVRAPGWRYRLEYPAGKVLYETGGWISHPRVSPTGDEVAFLDHPVFGDDRGSVAIVDRPGRRRRFRRMGERSGSGLVGLRR